jgi:ParB-like chromosome segregation protein Spo0J
MKVLGFKEIRLSDIRKPPFVVRREPHVDELFIESVKKDGLIEPIIVREMEDAESGKKYYELSVVEGG